MNVLVYANAPTAPTGFGTVVRNIFEPLVRRQRVPLTALSFYGVNYFGDPHNLPWARIWPAQTGSDQDPYGRQRFAHCVLSGVWPVDVLWVLEDHFTVAWPIQFPDGQTEGMLPGLIKRMRVQVEAGQRPPFRVIEYIPVDGDTLWPEWVTWMAGLVDYPVAYTSFGARVLLDIAPQLEGTLRLIPHGIQSGVFFPVGKAERDQYRQRVFGLGPDGKLVINVNRNQPRKDLIRTLQAFRLVLDQFPDAKLYLHCNLADRAGHNLERARINLRIPFGRVCYPANFSEGVGVPEPDLRMIYNAGDCFVTTARGEGWGFPVSEAMACGCPVVAPDHTSHHDLLRDGRGILVPTRERAVLLNDWDQLRPVADVDATAAAICDVLREPDKYVPMRDLALAWVRGLDWEQNVVPQWESLFNEAAASMTPPTEAKPLGLSLQAAWGAAA